MDSPFMNRLLAILLVVGLMGAGAPPAAARTEGPSPVLPPESSVVAPPPVGTPAPPQTLTRLGTLRIPAIGLSVPLYQWSCSDRTAPNVALRWRCSGTNNQFIFGHAYGVFHRYYLAWGRHQLKVGIVATFTSRSGHVTRYKLAWSRKVPRNYVWHGQTGDQWAWNATSRASITLQTCSGATNLYRIVTRFVKV